MLRKGRTLYSLLDLVKPGASSFISQQSVAFPCANYATKDKSNEGATSRLYKSLGIKPPKPRRQSVESRRLNAALKRSQEGLAHYALSSASHPGSHRSLPSSRRATKTKSRLFSSNQEKEERQGKEETDEDEQVQRILDAGSKRLFDSEEGRERLRENSFSNEETAKTVLNAAHEALEQPDDENASGNNGNGEQRSRDHARAKEASENIDKGKGNGVGSKVKAKVVGIGRIS